MKYLKNKSLETIKADWKGNPVFKGRFSNSDKPEEKFNPFIILKWKLSKNPQAQEKKNDSFQPKVINNDSFLTSSKDMIVWLGHATFFIRLSGITLITDPIFYSMPFFKRLVDFPYNKDNFRNIDYLPVSHFHMDHFNKKTINILEKNNPKMEVLIPLKGAKFFKKSNLKYQEAGWYQKYKTQAEIEVFFLPAKHWHKRTMFDTNKVLWGSFLIRACGKTIYFSGDTAYSEHFSEINNIFGNIDYCIMPVGAYKPDYIMNSSHISPEKSLKAFDELKGKIFIPMHYGTYDVSDEPPGEAVRYLESKKNSKIKILKIGEQLLIKKNQNE